MQVQEAMTSPIRAIRADATLLQAARKIHEQEVEALVVVEDGKPRGIVTGTDIARQVLSDDDARFLARRVHEITPQKMAVCFDDTDANHARTFMRKQGFDRLLVFNRERQIVGFARAGDLVPLTGRSTDRKETASAG